MTVAPDSFGLHAAYINAWQSEALFQFDNEMALC